MKDSVDTIVEKVGLNPAQVEGLVSLLLQGPIDNQTLSINTGLAKSILDDFRKEIGIFLKFSSNKTAFNEKGKQWAQQLRPQPFDCQVNFIDRL